MRKLVKDWTPIVPMLPHRKGVSFEEYNPFQWNMERRSWLAQFYPDAEDWRLAQRLNAPEIEIVRQAKRMHLQKSHNFKMWEKKDPNVREKGCPAGFHWETDDELKERIRQEHEMDERRALAIARGFDFCTHEEKEAIASVLVTAIEWGRESQPIQPRDYDYWE